MVNFNIKIEQKYKQYKAVFSALCLRFAIRRDIMHKYGNAKPYHERERKNISWGLTLQSNWMIRNRELSAKHIIYTAL